MKNRRFVRLLLAGLLLALLLGAQTALAESGECAYEIKNTDVSVLRDGLDDTAYAIKRSAEVNLDMTVSEENTFQSLYFRMDTAPKTVTVRWLNANRKYEDVAAVTLPGHEFTILLPRAVSGQIRIVFTFASQTGAKLTELRLFPTTEVPAQYHAWMNFGNADMLLVLPAAEALDASYVTSVMEAGHDVAVALLTQPASLLDFADELWALGIRHTILQAGWKTVPANSTMEKTWSTKTAQTFFISAIRQLQPLAVVSAGEAGDWISKQLTDAMASARDFNAETENAAKYGLWIVDMQAVQGEAVTEWGERGDDALRAMCAEKYADAEHADPARIPYPDNRLENGYLPEGEFVYENSELGLWAYLSPSLQIEIVRYEQPAIPRVWFVTEVKFDPAVESFGQRLYTHGSFKDQQTYPQTLAQNELVVLGINGDYYPYRVENKYPVGNILRNYKKLYDYDNRTSRAYPNLDTIALKDDGTLVVYDAKEITASELAAQGDVHDALSFGPYLARNGKLRIYSGSDWNATEPRNAIGMIEKGHYIILTVEGRFSKGVGPAGVNLNQLAEMMYSYGVSDAFNLDGGSTSVLIFMGEKLNRTASKSGKSTTSPRNMAELIGIGTSELVHTDWIHGDPSKK